jgi:hypothetical protein
MGICCASGMNDKDDVLNGPPPIASPKPKMEKAKDAVGVEMFDATDINVSQIVLSKKDTQAEGLTPEGVWVKL